MADGRILVRAWRIVGADPFGAMMWFDPGVEQPLLVRLLSGSDESGARPKVAPGRQMELPLGRRVGPPEGDAADEDSETSSDLDEPPAGWLSTLWEGGWDAPEDSRTRSED